MTMPTRSCCAGKFTVPVVGVGTWQFGSAEGEYWGARDQEQSNAIAAKAMEKGAAFFDCAEAYQSGRAESALAVALAASNAPADTIVATKIVPNKCSPKGQPGAVRAELVASLARLKRPSVYLYQVHWPLPLEDGDDAAAPSLATTFAELATLQKEGLIVHVGVSNFGPTQLRAALATGVTIATNQLLYNLVSRSIEFELAALCREHDIGVICYSPLLQGLLTDKGVATPLDALDPLRTRTVHFAGTREKSRHGGPGAEAELAAALAQVGAIAKREGVSVATLALAWCLANPAVVAIIPGASSAAHVEANVAGATYALSAAVKAELDAATEPVKAALGPKLLDPYQGEATQRSW